MEELLNKLIEKGWTKKAHHLYGLPNKPFVRRVKDSIHGVEFYYYEWWDNEAKLVKIYSLRDIVSIDSGLWQFVCENNLVDYDTESGWGEFSYNSNYINGFYGDRIMENDYRYRVIESALKDESELEGFLLNNIKI